MNLRYEMSMHVFPSIWPFVLYKKVLESDVHRAFMKVFITSFGIKIRLIFNIDYNEVIFDPELCLGESGL